MPGAIRRPLRAIRVTVRRPKMPPAIPSELWAGCRVCGSRDELISLLPRHGRVAEIGTDAGEFARYILRLAEPRELHVIDLDLSRFDGRLAADPRIAVHKGDSARIVAAF